MRVQLSFATLLLALCCTEFVVGRQVLHKRQDAGTTTNPGSTASSVATTTTPTGQSTPTSTGTDAASQSTQNSKATTSAGSTGTKNASTRTKKTTHTGHLTTSTSQSATPVPQAEQLPIKPKITPALGVAGVILMLTGLAYTIIGIKHKWLLVFLSTAYLAALGVSVLIIYVMSPPVSDAIQGAYMVAAVVTGLIFGAVSLVFKEVTEGLGCLLGGFCLAMWFLVLREGSLIHSLTGRQIMIAVFSAVGWSLSFSQYTRNYAAIFSAAFAGAMITMLGIDCFSRAGLKEFWLYIWGLNDNEFPIHTTTYPVTRGIRVEIAGTIILFLFGLMSQIKIWKIVKERRDKKESERLEGENQRDERDLDIGRNINANNEQSRAQWEAFYGDNKDTAHLHPDSGMGTSVSSLKDRPSVSEREIGGVELNDMGMTTKRGSKKGKASVLVRVASEDEVARAPESQSGMDSENGGWDKRSSKSVGTDSATASIRDAQSDANAHAGPSIVPLPFSPIVDSDDHHDARSYHSSLESDAAAGKAVHERRGVPLDKLALQRINEQNPAPALPLLEDDRASSVAAIADDETINDFASAGRLSTVAPSVNLGKLSPFDDKFQELDRSAPQTPGEQSVNELDDEALIPPVPAVEPLPPPAVEPLPPLAQSERTPSSASKRPVEDVDDRTEYHEAENTPIEIRKNRLPESMSKVAMVYRTNEWAKHIADAAQPDDEENPEPNEPGVQVDVGRPVEEPRRVDPEALLEKPSVPALNEMSRKSSTTPTSNPYRQSKDVHGKVKRSSSATPVYAFSSSPASKPLQRQSSSNSVQQSRLQTRNSSAPLAQQPLVESPIEEALANTTPYRNVSSPLPDLERGVTPMPSNSNLLDERNRLLQRRTTATSFANLNVITPSDSASARNVELTAEPDSDNISLSERKQQIQQEDENLTLSQRKTLMQTGQLPSPPTTSDNRLRQQQRPYRTSSTPIAPGLARMTSTTNPHLIYDSHQPRRSNTVDTTRQNEMLTQWRSSLQQQNANASANDLQMDPRQLHMSLRRQESYQDQKKLKERQRRESQMDAAMREGRLVSAHQMALRKMQAQVGKGGQ